MFSSMDKKIFTILLKDFPYLDLCIMYAPGNNISHGKEKNNNFANTKLL